MRIIISILLFGMSFFCCFRFITKIALWSSEDGPPLTLIGRILPYLLLLLGGVCLTLGVLLIESMYM